MAKTVFFPQDLVSLAERVIAENKAAGRKIALAESCTGGLVCAALTEIPGSSSVLDRGFVTYSNESKQELLDVQADIIDAFGAVSPATAWAMAQGAIRHSGADVAVAVSGTVVFALAIRGEEDVNTEQKIIEGANRAEIRHQAALVALEMLLPSSDLSSILSRT